MVYKVKEPPKEETIPQLTTEVILKKANDFRQAWMDDLNTDQKIRDKVLGMLDGAFRHITLLYMGMRPSSYGGFEIDNCNGRAAAFRSTIERLVEPTVRTMVDKYKDQILVEGLDQRTVDSLRKHYQAEINRALSQAVYKKAQSDADVLIDEILSEDRIHAQKLINNKVGGEELASGDVNGTT